MTNSSQKDYSKNLKPCPFCGFHKDKVEKPRSWQHDGWWYVYCRYCEARGAEADTEFVAKRMWNRRVSK